MPASLPATQGDEHDERESETAMRPRVYLAGPEVFLADAAEIGSAKVAICAEYGLEGVFPCDAELALAGLEPGEQARRIALVNEALMRSCDALIANLTPFRGASMDAGTAFEVGFMRALGRPVAGYTNVPLDYKARAEMLRAAPRLPFDGDRPDTAVENFGLSENLMIEVALGISSFEPIRHAAEGDSPLADLAAFERCVGKLSRQLAQAPAPSERPDDLD